MGLDPVTPVVVGSVLVPAVAGGAAAATAATTTAAAIAAANSAAALTAATTATTIVGAGTTGLIAPAATTASLGAAEASSGGILASTSAFLASPKGLALQAGFAGASTVGQGFAQDREAKAAATFSDFQARGAVLEGRRKALVELERVNKEQARQFAAVGASGILASGSATTSALETGRKGLANVQLIQLGAQISGRAELVQAENLRRRGRVAILGGFVSGSSRAARLVSSGNR